MGKAIFFMAGAGLAALFYFSVKREEIPEKPVPPQKSMKQQACDAYRQFLAGAFFCDENSSHTLASVGENSLFLQCTSGGDEKFVIFKITSEGTRYWQVGRTHGKPNDTAPKRDSIDIHARAYQDGCRLEAPESHVP